jgi:circadian clock protein KaiC
MSTERVRRGARGATTVTGSRRLKSGIPGLDELLCGGLPAAGVVVVMGCPGSGKTTLALQSLAADLDHAPGGLFCSFEENTADVRQNVASFPWSRNLERHTQFLDTDLEQSVVFDGEFDLQGLLAVLEERVARAKSRRIVLDGVDALLASLPPVTVRRELFCLKAWTVKSGVSLLITAKPMNALSERPGSPDCDLLQYLADCLVVLDHRLSGTTAVRSLQILKYRGASHSSNEFPLSIGAGGLEVGGGRDLEVRYPPSVERVSTGITRLDTMLTGGYFRGSSVLISGAPGTAKTSLCGTFAAAACARQERTLLVSFDEGGEQMVRNLRSINVQLERHLSNGTLAILSLRARAGASETHVARIRRALVEHRAVNLVVDPVSVFTNLNRQPTTDAAVELVDFAKSQGVTVVTTTLLDGNDPTSERTPIQLSTLADTWIHVSYLNQSGERNRALSVIKARGTAHSSQVRELVLSSHGVDLADVYTAGGEILMGTLRWEKEREEKERLLGFEQKERTARLELAEAEARLNAARQQQELLRVELRRLEMAREREIEKEQRLDVELKTRRGEDARETTAPPGRRRTTPPLREESKASGKA